MYIVGLEGKQTIQGYKRNCLATVHKKGQKPSLIMLNQSNGWAEASSQYGESITRVTAGLVVLGLVETHGFKGVMDWYLEANGSSETEKIFEKHFMSSMTDFPTSIPNTVN
jgi:hypothetical protein